VERQKLKKGTGKCRASSTFFLFTFYLLRLIDLKVRSCFPDLGEELLGERRPQISGAFKSKKWKGKS